MAVGDILYLTLAGLYDGSDDWMIGFHYRVEAVGSGEAEAKLASAWDTAALGAFSALQTAAISYDRLSVQKVDPAPLLVRRDFNPSLPNGVATGSPLPPQSALVLKKLSSLAGARHRGRVYVPGCPTDAQDEGFWNPGFQSSIDAAATTLDATLALDGYTFAPVIFHRDPAISPRYTTITNFGSNPIVRSQRRRQIGVGS